MGESQIERLMGRPPVRVRAFPGKSMHCIFIVDFHFDYESHCPSPHECGETGFD